MTFPSERQTSLEDALRHISAERTVWLRTSAVLDRDAVWRIRLAEIVSGNASPGWKNRTWSYPEAVFCGMEISGGEVAHLLASGRLPAGVIDAQVPTLNTQVSWERRQSASPSQFETLEWPTVECQLSMGQNSVGEPYGHLLSASDSPSFLSYYAAVSAFFLNGQPSMAGQAAQGIIYRHQDLRGRIDKVRIAADTIDITLSGAEKSSLTLDFGCDGHESVRGEQLDLSSTESFVRFPKHLDLPRGAWVLLRRNEQWVDRRFLTLPYQRGNDAGVEFVVDLDTRLETLLFGGERVNVELKRQVPNVEEKKITLMKSVCAFANGDGGSVLVGVDDDKTTVGLDPRSIGSLQDQITSMIRSWIEPFPIIEFGVLPIADSDRVVLELRVEPGTFLYGCGRPTETRVAYIRHWGITDKASTGEITEIIRARTTVTNDAFSAFR